MADGKKKWIIISVVAALVVGGIGVGSYLGQTKKGIGIQGAAGLSTLKNAGFDPAKSGKKCTPSKPTPRSIAPPHHG